MASVAAMEFAHAAQVCVGENVGIEDPERAIGTDPGAIGHESSR